MVPSIPFYGLPHKIPDSAVTLAKIMADTARYSIDSTIVRAHVQ
jgi:hypothetical protein